MCRAERGRFTQINKRQRYADFLAFTFFFGFSEGASGTFSFFSCFGSLLTGLKNEATSVRTFSRDSGVSPNCRRMAAF